MPPSDSQPPAPPPTEAVWPPPPQGRGGESGGLRIEQVEVCQTPDRLTLRNRRARQTLIYGCFAVPFIALLPLLLFWLSSGSSYPAGIPHTVWDYVAYVYLHSGREFLYMSLAQCAFLIGLGWFTYERRLHRGFFALDRRGGMVRAGGGVFCLLAELEQVLVARQSGMSKVYLIRIGGNELPDLTTFGGPRIPPNACLVADFRRQGRADDVAGIIAEFAGVPVRQSPS